MGIFIKSNSASEDCASGWMIPYIIYIEFYIYIYIYIYIESFNAISNTVRKANFLTWTGLRHTIHFILKTIEYTKLKENTYFIRGKC